jgi:S1-C subfamily serine protease
MNLREGMPRLLAIAFLAMILGFAATAQAVSQKPPGESPIAQPQSATDNKATEWAEIVAKIRPAVVVINTDSELASGFIIKPDGIIVTNHHVVANVKAMSVKLSTGEIYRNVSLLSDDPINDLAFLKIEAVDLPTVPLGNSNNVKLGDEVLLVGAPEGLEQTVSNGLISGIRLDDGVRILQTSAAASHGSSGGPLINRNGEAVGVMSFKLENGENLNFARPINYVRGKLDTLNASGPKPFAQLKDKAEQHHGVMVAGHGSEAFQGILLEVMDILGTSGVEVANHHLQKINDINANGFMPLSEMLEMLPESGADSLLYIKVEPGMTYRAATVYFQCFDVTGHILWEEKANDVLVDGGNTIFHPTGWKKRLAPHIGEPGLLLRQPKEENSPDAKK